MVFNRSSLSQDVQDETKSDFMVPGLHGDDEQTETLGLHGDDEQIETSNASSDDSIGYIISNQSLLSSLLENLASYDNVQLEAEIKAKVIKKVVRFRVLITALLFTMIIFFLFLYKG